ncbi:phage repressor protein CI [Rahnella laticis]|uniref:phage repressor protein CI n=1 Tax=Rahnella laticis TaxID=2787622 RepID=UPI0018A2DF71|nr:phage repressor protein CI [Rahnella laticis]MBF7993399.1 phage repressor protein CI [Rahnella laticis]
MDFKTGGQKVILRLVEAYGFSTRQMLCDHLGVSKSTLATRFMRDIFPAEWVIQCALETNASLKWLVSGVGPIFESSHSDLLSLPKVKLIDGELLSFGFFFLDKTLANEQLISPIVLKERENTYVLEQKIESISDGLWLIGIDGKNSLREITRLPSERIKIELGNRSFEAPINDIDFKGKVKIIINNIY